MQRGSFLLVAIAVLMATNIHASACTLKTRLLSQAVFDGGDRLLLLHATPQHCSIDELGPAISKVVEGIVIVENQFNARFHYLIQPAFLVSPEPMIDAMQGRFSEVWLGCVVESAGPDACANEFVHPRIRIRSITKTEFADTLPGDTKTGH